MLILPRAHIPDIVNQPQIPIRISLNTACQALLLIEFHINFICLPSLKTERSLKLKISLLGERKT